jgi:hypothetical protein
MVPLCTVLLFTLGYALIDVSMRGFDEIRRDKASEDGVVPIPEPEVDPGDEKRSDDGEDPIDWRNLGSHSQMGW